MLHRGDDSRGAGALVRLSTTEAAAQAISTLNNYMPRGPMGEPLAAMPLLVRFADSAEEKARKQARKEQFATRLGRPSMEAPQLANFEDPRSAGAQLPNVPNGLPAGFEAFGASGRVTGIKHVCIEVNRWRGCFSSTVPIGMAQGIASARNCWKHISIPSV